MSVLDWRGMVAALAKARQAKALKEVRSSRAGILTGSQRHNVVWFVLRSVRLGYLEIEGLCTGRIQFEGLESCC